MSRRIAHVGLALALAVPLAAQSQVAGWDVSTPRGTPRQIDFETDEGTWTNLTMSPDGKTILFDLLGHIYRMDSRGGRATVLTGDSGQALNFHPRYAPDGKTIAFISDRGGQNNIWLMDADGRNVRALWIDRATRFTSPKWMPDGRSLVAVRHTPTMQGMHRRVASIWQVPIDGTPPRQLLADADANFYDPAPSADGRAIFFMKAFLFANRFGTESQHVIQKLDLGTGAVEDVVANAAPADRGLNAALGRTTQGFGVMAPMVSPDGRTLAFVRQNNEATVRIGGHVLRPRTEIWLRDLGTGHERRIVERATVDLSGAHAMYSLTRFPIYDWSPDGGSLLYTVDGKIKSVDIASGAIVDRPYRARVQRTLSEQVRGATPIGRGDSAARFLQWPATSPDGQKLAFSAAGHLWLADLPGGQARRLSPEDDRLYLTPSWSSDGSALYYATWSEAERGAVWRLRMDGSAPQRIPLDPGEYLHPTFDTATGALLVVKGQARTTSAYAWSVQNRWQLLRLAAGASKPVLIHESTPMLMPLAPSPMTGGRMALQLQDMSSDRQRMALVPRSIVPIDTTEDVSIVSSGTGIALDQIRISRVLDNNGGSATEARLSPDGAWIAAMASQSIYVARVPDGPSGGRSTLRLDADLASGPFRRVGDLGGLFPRWRADGKLEFFSGNLHSVYDPATETLTRQPIEAVIRQPASPGPIAITNARLLTMEGTDGVVESGSIVVTGSRISCVGSCDVSKATRIIDARGKTVMPGIIDTHVHHSSFYVTPPLLNNVVPLHHASSANYLAFGVTTVFDPASKSNTAFALADLVESGRHVGPRTLSTGEAVYGWGDQLEIRTPEDALHHARRRKLLGAPSLKNYRLDSRDQSQMLIEAARAQNMSITAEGGDFAVDLGFAIDGQTGFEHYIPMLPIYGDVARFFGEAGIVYAPTVTPAGHPYGALHYYRGKADLRTNAKFTRFMSKAATEERMALTAHVGDDAFSFPIIADGLAKIMAAGGHGAIGDHSEDYGLGSHHEIWSYAGALGASSALRIGTIGGAYALGIEQDTGSLKTGKLADLVILDADPLVDIRNSTRIRFVMKGGRLFDAETLDEIWPTRKRYGTPVWDEKTPGQSGLFMPDHAEAF